MKKKKKRKKDIIKIIIKSTVNQTCLVSRGTFNKKINTQLNTGISANLLTVMWKMEVAVSGTLSLLMAFVYFRPRPTSMYFFLHHI